MAQQSWGIILGCGKDQQIAGDTDTAFLSVGSHPAIVYSLKAFEGSSEIDGVIVVVRKERMESIVQLVHMYGFTKVKKVLAGSQGRRTTIQNALNELDKDVHLVCVHEASRPCVSSELVDETVKAAKRYGCGVAAAKMTEPVREAAKGQKVSGTLDFNKLWAVQTPQAIKRDLLEKGLAKAAEKKVQLAEESEAVSLLKKPIHLVGSSRNNFKISDRDDLLVASALLSDTV